MAIVYFNGGHEDEQAKGRKLDNGIMSMYAVRRDEPTRMIYLGGHRMDDAPTYNTTEGKVFPVYKKSGGRNVVVEDQLSGDVVKSVVINLQLPNRLVSVTDLIYQQQAKCDYDLFFIPDACDEGCDEFFWMGESMKLSAKQIQNSIVGYDDNEAPINLMRTARFSGNLLESQGTELSFFNEASQAMYAILVIEDTRNCDGCGCPYQTIVRGGAAPALGQPVLEYTVDGGVNWSVISTATLPEDSIITDIKYSGGYLTVSYSDVAAGIGTDGGVAYSFGVGPALALSTLDVASDGIQTMEVVGGKLYAFGTAGETYLSCDNGLTFTQNTGSPITTTILDSAYDNELGLIFLATSAAEAWTFDEVGFVEIDPDFTPTGAVDLESVEVLRPGGGVAFGGANGNYYEAWDFEGLGVGTWVTEIFGAGTIGAIIGDGRGYRTFIGHGDDIVRRSVLTEQQWEVYSTALVGDITALESAGALVDEGANYFIGVTDTGETFKITKCNLCLEGC